MDDLKRAAQRFQADHMIDHAASLTYFLLLSLFPTLLFTIAVLGFFGGGALITDTADYLSGLGASPALVDIVRRLLATATSDDGTALGALVIGLVTALYGASGAFGAAGRALNVVFRVEEGRGFVTRKLRAMGATIVVIVLALVALVLVFVGGGLSADIFGVIGLGDTAAAVWNIARWPAALVVAMVIYAWVYYAAPNVEIPRFRWITPGAATGVLIWIAGSGAFFAFVANFSSYNATYGTFAGLVLLLTWLWLTNLALLFGAELNAQIDRRRSPGVPRDYAGPPLPEKVSPEA